MKISVAVIAAAGFSQIHKNTMHPQLKGDTGFSFCLIKLL